MNLRHIVTKPDPYEPFRLSQGYRIGDLPFISGQAAYDEDGEIVSPGNFDAQATQAFSNLDRALRADAAERSETARAVTQSRGAS